MTTRNHAFYLLLLVLIALVGLLPAQPSAAASTDLIFSEYVEGGSNNKALELYNPADSTVDLGAENYLVQIYFNGQTSVGRTINLTGTVAPGETFVIAHSSAAFITANGGTLQPDLASGGAWFSGNDAVVLRRDSTVIDSIGQVGDDPGTEWGSGPDSTADSVLRRDPAICVGDRDINDAFDPAVTWDGSDNTQSNIVAGLGSHQADCSLDNPPSVVSTDPIDGATDVPVDTNITLTFSEAVVPVEPWYSIVCSESGTVSAAVSGSNDVWTLDPAADFQPDDLCEVTLTAQNIVDVDDTLDPMTADYTFTFTPSSSQVVFCGETATPIHAVQGDGLESPLEDQIVTVEGVVVGDFQGSGALRGFFVQEEAADADNDDATSEGLFVFDPDTLVDVSVGDQVRVTGTVVEYDDDTETPGDSLTELTNVTEVTACGTAALPSPVEVTLPLDGETALERVEGMFITLPQTLTVTEVYNLGRFGEVWLSTEGRLMNPTNEVPPGAPATVLQSQNDLARILIDDGTRTQNPDPIPYIFGDQPTLRLGDTAAGITGVLTASFDEYRLHPTSAPNFTRGNPRPEQPPQVGGRLQVASVNVLNYFNGDGQGGGFPTTRGADDLAELERQREKLVASLLALDADVLGLVEIENDGYGPDSALAGLVNALNVSAGANTYDYIEPSFALGSDEIKVALIYKPATVQPVGSAATTTAPPFDNRRPPLAASFEEVATGERLTVVVSHLKSKGCGDATGANAAQGDGQGCWNAERVQAVNTLLDWLDSAPTGIADPDRLLIGDLNAYAEEDPITALIDAGYTDLVETFTEGSPYTYVFFGQSGTLDYAFANPALTPQVTGAGVWHINADEPRILDYNLEYKSQGQQALNVGTPYRASDHDPVLVGLDLDSDPLATELMLLAPPDIISNGYGNPLYRWGHLPGVTAYNLFVMDTEADEVVINLTVPATYCDVNTCEIDPTELDEAYRLFNGPYSVYLQPMSGEEAGDWSGPFAFTLAAVPPGIVDINPVTGIDTAAPTFHWTLEGGAANATHFRLYVAPQADLANVALDQWFTRAETCGSADATTCQLVSPADLNNGVPYLLFIRSYGPGGLSTSGTQGYAESEPFTLNAPLPAVPNNLVVVPNQGRPTLTWDDDPNALWYQVYVGSGSDSDYLEWVEKADIDCDGQTCTFKPPIDFPGGPYSVYMRAWGPAGFSTAGNRSSATDGWAGPLPLNLPTMPPTIVSGIETLDADSGTPTFQWTGVENATWYQLWVGTPDAAQTLYTGWHLASDLGCENAGACEVTPELFLANGSYAFYVQSYGPGGLSSGGTQGWAGPGLFTVSADPAQVAAPLSPSGAISLNAPTFTWAHTNGVWYQLWIGAPDASRTDYQGWHSADALNCASGTCSLTPPDVLLSDGDYAWAIQTYTPHGASDWSELGLFEVVP